MQVIHKLKMDLLRQNNTQIIDAVQLDSNTRKLELSLYEGAMPWNVPEGVSVAVAYSGPGGNGIYDTLPDGSSACTVAGNVVTATVIPQALAMHGNVQLTVVFTDDSGKQLSTFCVTFRVAVNPAVGAVEPEPYFNIRQWVDAKVADKLDELANNISGISVFARFVTSKGYVLSIDTNAMTIRIPDGYVFLKRPKTNPSRLSVTNTTCAINTESAFSFVVMDVVTKVVSSIKPDNFDATAQVVLAVLWKGHYTDPAANWIMGPYQVNGFLYNAPVEQAVYVATTGSDSNVGDRNNPFRTINKAVASGAKTIFVFAGTYRESISASRVGGEIEILAKPISKTDKDVVLDLGQELVMSADSITGLVKAAYAKTANDFIYKAFVSKSETLVYDDGFLSNGYACNLWRGNTKLRPVLTLAECQASANTWFYDGANVYANAEAGAFTLADGAADYGIHLSYFKKVKLMGIDVRHAKMDGVKLVGCNDAEISRCTFGYTGLYTGLALENTSATVRNCEAMYNRTDGFNIHGVGTADFIDCVSHDNWDDGISHHDQSGGMILGGEYYHNGKGGVCSPTFGSRNSINGVYIHNNRDGVYAVTDSDGEYPTCTVCNCTIVNNTNGVRTSRYELLGWNNTVSGNRRDVVEENGGSWTVMGGSSSGTDYILPVAKPNRLGGVKPVAATYEMTQPVGVTQDGKLVTAPGGSAGSGGSDVVGWKQIFDFKVEEEVSAVTIDVSEAAPLMKKALYARVDFFAAKVSSADVIGTKPSGTIVWTCDGISSNTWINNGKIMPRVFQTSGGDGGYTIRTCWTIFNTIEPVADFVILPANRSPESRVFNSPFLYTYMAGKEVTIQITANDSAIGVGSYLKIYVAG